MTQCHDGDFFEASVRESSSESEEVALLHVMLFFVRLYATFCLPRSLVIHFDVPVKILVKGEKVVLVKLLVCIVTVIVGVERKSFLAKSRLDVKKCGCKSCIM